MAGQGLPCTTAECFWRVGGVGQPALRQWGISWQWAGLATSLCGRGCFLSVGGASRSLWGKAALPKGGRCWPACSSGVGWFLRAGYKRNCWITFIGDIFELERKMCNCDKNQSHFFRLCNKKDTYHFNLHKQISSVSQSRIIIQWTAQFKIILPSLRIALTCQWPCYNWNDHMWWIKPMHLSQSHRLRYPIKGQEGQRDRKS